MAAQRPLGSEDNGRSPARQGIQSVELAMTVVRTMEEGRGPMSLTQIATASGMQPSKVHRYLVSLARVGLVTQSRSSGRYDLGPTMRRLGIESLRRMDEVALVSEHLPELRDRTSHAVNLAVWGELGPVVVRWEYGAHALAITVRVGATMPLLNSALGGVFLAHLSEQLTDPVLCRQLRVETLDPSTRERLRGHREDVLREGVAKTFGGVIPDMTSVAAPVFPAGGALPLAVSLVMPARDITEQDLADLSAELLRSTSAMSEELGHSPHGDL